MPQLFGKASRTQPTAVADTSQAQMRTTIYGDVTTTQMGDSHTALADEGAYFKVTNTTPGTGILTFPATMYTSYANAIAGSPLFILRNTGTAGGKRCYIDYVRLLSNTAALNAGNVTATTFTTLDTAVVLDTTNRYASGGQVSTTGLNQINNVNTDSSASPIAAFAFAGASPIVTTAVSAPRIIARTRWKTQAGVVTTGCTVLGVGDMFSMDFGEHASGGAFLSGTTAAIYPASVGPAIIGGGHSLLFYLWSIPSSGTTAAPTLEFEIAWWER